MSIKDRLYLRFGLYVDRNGRKWFATIEWLILAMIWVSAVFVILSFVRSLVWMYGEYQTAEQRATAALHEAKVYQSTLLTCLNGGIIGHAGEETVTCEKAYTFKFMRLK